MGNSIKLFSVRGIAIRMHITFPLILVWTALQFGLFARGGWIGAVFGIMVTLLLFAIVVLHELGHSIAAQRYNIPVKQIVLLPIGGVAQVARIPEKPSEEFVIAIAGPMVNFILAIVLAVGALISGVDLGFDSLASILPQLGSLNLESLFRYVFASNLFLALFNLLPAFPMDGGRVLRALMATRMPYARATMVAVAIGQSIAWLLGLWGFLQGGLFLIVIAVFIYMGASQEGQIVQARSMLSGLRVEHAYSRKPKHLNVNESLRQAIELTLNTFQSDFPVCDGERLVGLLTHTRLVEALDKYGPDIPIRQVMLTNIEPVTTTDELIDVQRRLVDSKVDALPVEKDGRFMGLITSRDLNEIVRMISSRADLLPTLAAVTQE
jgi:Zn-dependent protease/CBS domain-containing protein